MEPALNDHGTMKRAVLIAPARGARKTASCSTSLILVGAASRGGEPVGKNRLHGANDPRRNGGLALAH